MGFVLASRSPRRRVLLRLLVDDFDVDASQVEETAPRGLGVDETVALIARKKAMAVSQRRGRDWVLGADTIVAADGERLGQPADADDARRMLALLSGATHLVWTGLALAWDGGIVDSRSVVSAVSLRRLRPATVDAYIASGSWRGKAGGYGIQDPHLAPYLTVQSGPWSNVVGLPLAATAALLRDAGLTCREPPAESWLAEHNPFDEPPGSRAIA